MGSLLAALPSQMCTTPVIWPGGCYSAAAPHRAGVRPWPRLGGWRGCAPQPAPASRPLHAGHGDTGAQGVSLGPRDLPRGEKSGPSWPRVAPPGKLGLKGLSKTQKDQTWAESLWAADTLAGGRGRPPRWDVGRARPDGWARHGTTGPCPLFLHCLFLGFGKTYFPELSAWTLGSEPASCRAWSRSWVRDGVGSAGHRSQSLEARKSNVQVTKRLLGREPRVRRGPSPVAHRLGGHRAPSQRGQPPPAAPRVPTAWGGASLSPHTLGRCLFFAVTIMALKTNAAGMLP